MLNSNFLSVKENNEFFVVQFKSKLGHIYEVGYPKQAGYTLEKLTENLTEEKSQHLEKRDFCSLKWEINKKPDGTFQNAIDIGCMKGFVVGGISKIYQSRLHFKNTKDLGFEFQDEAGDIYFCSTYFNSWHYIDYNSSQSTIVGVR